MSATPSTQYTPVALPDLSMARYSALVERIELAVPEQAARIRRGANVLLNSRILETDQAGTYLVQTSDGSDLYYRASTTRCTCPDTMQRRVVCKHSWARVILQSARIDARDAAFGLASAPPMLPRPSLDPDRPIPFTLTAAADAALDTPEPVPAA